MSLTTNVSQSNNLSSLADIVPSQNDESSYPVIKPQFRNSTSRPDSLPADSNNSPVSRKMPSENYRLELTHEGARRRINDTNNRLASKITSIKPLEQGSLSKTATVTVLNQSPSSTMGEKVSVPQASHGTVTIGDFTANFTKLSNGAVAVTHKGWRNYMEDKISFAKFDANFGSENRHNVEFYGLADGNDGPMTSELLTQSDDKGTTAFNMARVVKHQLDLMIEHEPVPFTIDQDTMPPAHVYNALKTAPAIIHEEIQEHLAAHQARGSEPASMFTMALVSNNNNVNTGKITVTAGNIGDSASGISTRDKHISTSEDDSFDVDGKKNKRATKHIEKRNGCLYKSGQYGAKSKVLNKNSTRSFGGYPTAKGIGFHGQEMQFTLDPRPGITQHTFDRDTAINSRLWLASDGVVGDNVLSGDEVSNIIQHGLQKEKPAEETGTEILRQAYNRSVNYRITPDNMSLIIAPLVQNNIEEQMANLSLKK